MDRSETIRELLDALNNWSRQAPGGNIADTGEVSSKITVLRKRLAELGVRVSWNGERYVIEEIEEK